MITEQFKINDSGSGLNSSKRSECKLCGWEGVRHYAHNDYQLHNLSVEQGQHSLHCTKINRVNPGLCIDIGKKEAKQ